MIDAVNSILKYIGEDPGRDGLRDTPERVQKAFSELTSGYQCNPADVLKTFENDGDYTGMVVVSDIPVYSLCEHHMLPFHGSCHVVYIPNGRIVGLSKIARLVECFARRLQVQERLTQQIADALHEHLSPLGAMVVIEAEHFCMTMRGVQKPGSTTTTSSVLGVLESKPAARAEAMSLIGMSR